MQRRQFITLIGGVVSTLPFGAAAQLVRKWRIGLLHPGQSDTVNMRIRAFQEGLGVGASGQDVELVVRTANQRLDQLPDDGVGPCQSKRSGDLRGRPSGCPRGA
jgi:hypothetical protein